MTSRMPPLNHDQSPGDILSTLPQLPSRYDAANSVPLLLVTSGLAHWLDDSGPFLGQFLSRLYPGSRNANSLYAVAAVIDKLPGSLAQNKESASNDHDTASLKNPEVEGLSLLIVGNEDIHGKAAPQRRIGGPASEETDLVLRIQSQGVNQPTGSAYQVGLRLANTIFINGKESTLFGIHGSYDERTGAYALDRKVDLTSCVVTSTTHAVQCNLALPLHPVTQRRRVLTSMGNILRQVAKSTDPDSVEPMPASAELEKELPRYIHEHNIIDQRVSVWALVEKPDVVIADPNAATQDRVVESLRQGGKLHRVMSGGGGWGKKQGLLSLDPEISFPGTARRNELVGLDELLDPNPDAPLGMPSFLVEQLYGDDLSLLSQVAAAGDFIQFFVGVDSVPPHAGIQTDHHHDESVTYHFGVRSNVEEVEMSSADKNEKPLVKVRNSFGALPEKAISFTQPVVQGSMTTDSSTKLDIPGCLAVFSSV